MKCVSSVSLFLYEAVVIVKLLLGLLKNTRATMSRYQDSDNVFVTTVI